MPEQHSDTHPPRRRRRRRLDRPAVSAGLLLDEQLKGDIGVLSEDLWVELFPKQRRHDAGDGHSDTTEQDVRHVAISPWMPLSSNSMEDASWTILPVRPPLHDQSQNRHLAHSTIHFPAASLSLQTFTRAYEFFNPNKNLGKNKSTLEIRVLDVAPLGLDTVFVSIDAELVKTLDQSNGSMHGVFGGPRLNGFASTGKGKGKAAVYNPTDRLLAKGISSTDANDTRLRGLIREAISSPRIIHSGDLLPLPLLSHPITHAPPPPAKVTFCEPVSQGLLLPDTKIVVTRTQHHVRPSRVTPSLPVRRMVNGLPEEDEEDTSDDRFYSANEGYGSSPLAPSSEEQEDEVSTTDVSESEENDYLSDDSLDDIISISAPLFPQTPSVLSAFQPGTPHGIAGGRRTNGVNTPGSVFSSYTSRTARASGPTGSLFKAQALLERVPDTLLHPKPLADEDDEARVFVDVSTLVKIGCFSGDWVRLEGSSAPASGPLGIWSLGAFENAQEQKKEWRVAKVYGLPESYSGRRPGAGRRALRQRNDAETLTVPKDMPKVYLPPFLHGNLHLPTHLRLSQLAPGSQVQIPSHPLNPKQDQLSSSSSPPLAKEVTLLKMSTPLSTDRTLQPSILMGLKQFLEKKRRAVKADDWVGVNFDESLGRTLYQIPKGPEDDAVGDELLSGSSPCAVDEGNSGNETRKTGVAWFKVGNVVVSGSEAIEDPEEDVWGGVVSIDPTSTRVVQTGSEKSKSLGTLRSSWEYYLGLKKPPKVNAGLALRDGISEMPQPRTTPLRRRLRELVSVATSPRAIHLGLQPIVILLTSTQRNIGKATVAARACADLGIHSFPIDAYDILTDGGAGGGDVKAEALFKARCERAMSCGPEFCALIIRHIEALTADRMVSALKDAVADSRVFIATTTEVEKVPEGVRGLFTHELEMSAPDEGEREDILRGIVEDKCVKVASDVDLASVAVRTAALVAGDLVDVVDRAVVARTGRIELVADNSDKKRADSVEVTVRDVLVSGGEASRCVTKADFDIAVDHARKNFADAIGAPKIPNVSWDDVGGLTNVKDAVMETIQLPLERPELFAKGMKKRSGILFYGPPGTGKTLLAKAIATEFSLNFFSVKGPELLNMYIGESEANVRRVFQRARDARPCVVFFDELDSVAPKRGNQGDSGGVMDRIVSQLLAELDGMSDGEEGGGGVFVIGATNRPDLLDQALLRPGRFDKMLYLGISDTHDKQLTILEALTRKFTLHPSMSLRRVAESLPFTYTGADLYALCSDAMLKAITRQANAVDRKIKALPSGPVTTAYFFDHLATSEDTAVVVTETDFFDAKRELVGSVSAKELEHYERVRKSFEATDEGQTAKRPTPPFQLLSRTTETIFSEPATRTNGKTRVSLARRGKAQAPSGWDTPDGDISDHQANDEEGGYRDDDGDDDEDEHIICTEHLVINGVGSGVGGEGKGKGKGKGGRGIFEDPSEGDERELYG
ncbi:MAG: peroxisomal assembly protein [Geoglossum umbratile]|nr:MAG: peroxisomal assembly protein [Geoglossum umbratile]